MIALIDYGAGNLTSVRKALAAVGAEFWTPAAADELVRAHGVVIPGVGHFDATRALDGAWRTGIRAAVQRGTPLLGICLGMQFLFEGSAESPDLPGLGLFPGKCIHLASAATSTQEQKWGRVEFRGAQKPKFDPAPFKVPHVGWNNLVLRAAGGLMEGVTEGAYVYFTHSYVAPVGPGTAAVTHYGMPFTAAVADGRVGGVQFHPEKSAGVGLRILGNWLRMCA